jgi:hypothetical protein
MFQRETEKPLAYKDELYFILVNARKIIIEITMYELLTN